MVMLLHISLVILLCNGVFFQRGQSALMSFQYKQLPCSTSDVIDIITAPVIDTKRSLNVYQCAALCGTSGMIGGCRYAVFWKVRKTCFLYKEINNVSWFPDFTRDEGCRVLLEPFCHNNGRRVMHTCACPNGFTGRFCEIENPTFCQTRQWRLAKESDYPLLSTSQIPIKFEYGSEIAHANTFDVEIETRTKFVAQVNGYFAFKESSPYWLKDPHQKVFLLFNISTGESRIAILSSDGSVDVSSMDLSVKIYIPSEVDQNRFIYDQNVGNLSEITSALSDGYRLLRRDPTQVGFEHTSNKAFYQGVLTRLNLNRSAEFDWTRPLTYRSYTESLGLSTRHVLTHTIGTPEQKESFSEQATPSCEMDRCWTKIQPTESIGEFVSVLSEYVARGKEIRVVVDNEISSDLVAIYAVQNDVIVQLPDDLTPFDPSGSLDSSTTKRRSAVTVTRKVARCSFGLGSNPIRQNDLPGLKSVEWYVASRRWTKVFSVKIGGGVLYGNKTRLHEAVFGGWNIRVCVIRDLGVRIFCHSSTAIRKTDDGHLVFQLYPYLRMSSITGAMYDWDCRRVVRLVSTDGAHRKAFVKDGSTRLDYEGAGTGTIEWFVEE